MNRPIRILTAALVASLVFAGCSGDDGGLPEADPIPDISTSTIAPDSGGIDVPEIPGTFAAPVPSLGFGIAIPEGWQATLLSEDALERVAQASLADPTFLEAARSVAATGAVFYAAGVDDEGRVAELKIDLQDGADSDPDAVQALARTVIADGGFSDAEIVDGPLGVRVDFTVQATDAEDGSPIVTMGSQLFVADGGRLWSIILTAEDPDTRAAVRDIVEASFVLA